MSRRSEGEFLGEVEALAHLRPAPAPQERAQDQLLVWCPQPQETFYSKDCDELVPENDNFEGHVALSDPQTENTGQG